MESQTLIIQENSVDQQHSVVMSSSETQLVELGRSKKPGRNRRKESFGLGQFHTVSRPTRLTGRGSPRM